MKGYILLVLVIFTAAFLASAEKVVRVGGSVVGNQRVYQSLDIAELEKFDWNPSQGEVPLSAGKAIAAANNFCKTRLPGKVPQEIWQLRLVSRKANGVNRWYWLALYAIESDQAVSGQSMLVVPVSFGGKAMVEIVQIVQSHERQK